MSPKISTNYLAAFQSADIRGVYPTEINEELTYLIARAFVDEYAPKSVLVARDMRLSTPALHSAFCKGVVDAGAGVIDIGMVDTPVMYFASGTLKLPGVMITASHSPKQYNGLKLVLSGAIPLTESKGLKQIRRRIEKGIFREVKKPGALKAKDVLPAYAKFVFKGMKTVGLEKMKVAVDVGNGMSAVLLPILKARTPITYTALFPELDGRFPNRGSDPTLKKNQKHITKKLQEGGFDFGVAFDGDADRIAFFDEQGAYINSAAIGALVAEQFLKKTPKAKIVYTTLTSRIYQEKVKAAGGRLVLARVGHTFIKETMRKKDVIFGCEHSGHFYFKDYFFTDSAVLTLRSVLTKYEQAKAEGVSFSKMMAVYQPYKQTQDVTVEARDKVKSQKLVEEYLLAKKPISAKKFDGISVDFGEVWGSVKISVTEPALKIMFESTSLKKAQALQSEVVEFVKKQSQ